MRPSIVLAQLKRSGFRLAIISNSESWLMDGNVGRLGGYIDRAITAEQANSYKPSRVLFDSARSALGVAKERTLHICASPALDHVAARDQQFRCVWIDRGTYRKPLCDYQPNATLPSLVELPGALAQAGWT